MAAVVRVVLQCRMRYIEAKSGCWAGRSDAYKPVHVAGLCFGYRLPTKHPNISYTACPPNTRIYYIPPAYQTPEYIIYWLPTKPTISPYIACVPNPPFAHILRFYQTPEYIIHRLPTKHLNISYTAPLPNPRLAHISPAYHNHD